MDRANVQFGVLGCRLPAVHFEPQPQQLRGHGRGVNECGRSAAAIGIALNPVSIHGHPRDSWAYLEPKNRAQGPYVQGTSDLYATDRLSRVLSLPLRPLDPCGAYRGGVTPGPTEFYAFMLARGGLSRRAQNPQKLPRWIKNRDPVSGTCAMRNGDPPTFL